MILEKILSKVDPATFLKTYFLKLPFAQAGGCLAYAPLAGWPAIEAILAQDGADIIVGRGGQAHPGPKPRCFADARALLVEGFTIGIRHAERQDSHLHELAQAFQRDFAAVIDVQLYCTPAGQPGFGWHYDAEDVFIFQCSGSKEWSLRKNTVNPWPLMDTLPLDMRYEREIMPLMRCRLEPGDWLYVPAGYWHHTEAGEESVSLSIGIQSLAALHAYDFLRTKLLAMLEWRQRLPPLGEASAGAEDALLDEYHAIFRGLGEHLARLLGDERLAREFIAAQRARFKPQAAEDGPEVSGADAREGSHP